MNGAYIMYAPKVAKQTRRPQKSCSVPPRSGNIDGTPTRSTLRTVSKSSNQSNGRGARGEGRDTSRYDVGVRWTVARTGEGGYGEAMS